MKVRPQRVLKAFEKGVKWLACNVENSKLGKVQTCADWSVIPERVVHSLGQKQSLEKF